LPGSSLATVKEGIHRISLEKLPYPLSHHWAMLPATPAADPKYREKFKIQTVSKKASTGVGSTSVLKKKPGRTTDPGVSMNANEDEITGEYVVGTFSYTAADWIDMNLLQIFTSATQNSNILNLIADYMWSKHQIHYGEFFWTCLDTILNDQVDPTLQKNFLLLKKIFQDWLVNDDPDLYVDFDDLLDFKIAPSIFYIFTSLINNAEFFTAIKLAITKFIPINSEILDLCHYSKERLIDIDYKPGKKFTCNYDWPKYIQDGTIEKRQITFIIKDTQIQTGGRWFDIDWYQHNGLDRYKQFIYRVAYDFRGTKMARNIEEIKIDILQK
jgi:hypothetical protein